jgi:hypothetical protein
MLVQKGPNLPPKAKIFKGFKVFFSAEEGP